MRRRGMEPMHDEHINVTPLIDVVMCLIIFFLVCGRMAQQESNDQVVVPRAELGQEMSEQRGHLVINVVPAAEARSAAPEIYVRGQQLSMTELQAYLRKEKTESPDVKVILRADQEVAYEWISPILIACAEVNIKSVNFSTMKE